MHEGASAARQPAGARIPHLPALDGLRGLALLGVLLFHADELLVGGYLGVDLFFVLSGYLITALLLAEHRNTGRINLPAFWLRRARRLFPALLALIALLTTYQHWLARPEDLARVRSDAIATLAYVANWHFIFGHTSYWDLFAAPSPLQHTWSLAIEEQFYLLWPLMLLPVLRRSRRAVLALTLTLGLASMVAMMLLFDPAHSSRAYFGTDTRATAILLGAAFAVVLSPDTALNRRAARWLDVLGAAALVVIGLAWWKLEGTNSLLYHGGLWCTELAALVLIGCAVAGERSFIGRGLSAAPLRLLGRISYGAYLWHWPVNVVLSPERTGLPPLALDTLRLVVTFIITAASYRYLEQPIRKRGLPFGHPWLVVSTTVALVVALVLGVPSATASIARAAGSRTAGTDSDAWRLLVLGDSTANAVGWTMRSLHFADVSVELGGEDGFSLHNDGPKWATWSTRVKQLRPDASLVVLSGAFLYGMTADGSWRDACYPAWDRTFETALTARLRDLKTAPGARWITTVPYALGHYDNAKFRERIDCINPILRKVVAKVGGIQILDLAEIHCPHGVCRRTIGGKPIRPDGVHYDADVARPIAMQLLQGMRSSERNVRTRRATSGDAHSTILGASR